jgi:hypothetical protein
MPMIAFFPPLIIPQVGGAASSHLIALLSPSTGEQTLVDTYPTNIPLYDPAHEATYNISLPRVDRTIKVKNKSGPIYQGSTRGRY